MCRSKLLFALISLMALASYQTVIARTLTSADLASSPSLTLPAGWGIFAGSPDLLFDGVTTNPEGNRFAPEQGSGGSRLSSSNFISVTVDFINPMAINSFHIANDYGGSPTHEAVAMEVILRGNGQELFSFSGNIEDDVIDDIDVVFSGVNVVGVTSAEFRIIQQDVSTALEIREFILDGTEASAIPEPTSFLLLLCSGVTLLVCRGHFC